MGSEVNLKKAAEKEIEGYQLKLLDMLDKISTGDPAIIETFLERYGLNSNKEAIIEFSRLLLQKEFHLVAIGTKLGVAKYDMEIFEAAVELCILSVRFSLQHSEELNKVPKNCDVKLQNEELVFELADKLTLCLYEINKSGSYKLAA